MRQPSVAGNTHGLAARLGEQRPAVREPGATCARERRLLRLALRTGRRGRTDAMLTLFVEFRRVGDVDKPVATFSLASLFRRPRIGASDLDVLSEVLTRAELGTRCPREGVDSRAVV